MCDWRRDPATDRQREYANKLGISIPANSTKGQASNIISEAEAKKNISSSDGAIAFGKQGSIFSRIKDLFFRSKAGSTHFASQPCHAKPGTFEEFYFINPKTGKFQFPKYKQEKQFLVEIVDNTKYKEELWDSLDSEDKRHYSLWDFEEEFTCDIEVEPFKNLFYKTSTDHLKPLQYLKGQWNLIEKLLLAEDNEFIVFDSSVVLKLMHEGFLYEQIIVSIEDKLQYFNLFKVSELKDACKKVGLKVESKKQEIVDKMIQSDVHFDLPKVGVSAPSFHQWFDGLVDLYLSDIQRNSDRFHPLYIEEIWTSALDQAADIAILEDKIRTIIYSKYWLSRLTNK